MQWLVAITLMTMNDDGGCNHLIPPELTRDSLTSSWDSLFLEKKSIYSIYFNTLKYILKEEGSGILNKLASLEARLF